MPRQRKPVVHAITVDEFADVMRGRGPALVLEALERRGLRIARVPGRPRFRHADTGEYVSAGEAARNPDRVVSET